MIGEFELLSPLGEGGMGTVWHGRHGATGVDVAIKVTRSDVMDDPEFREAFEEEIRSVAALDHRNIVTILDFGTVERTAQGEAGDDVVAGSPYLVMEYASGGSVLDYFDELKWPDVRELLLVILDALAHAHARNVIHRDLKPENILVGCGPDWDVKLTDFGLAHAANRFDDSGKVETAWGTPQYMAPEQLRGLWREYGPWTDIYGLGCMAYELICNKWPFHAETVSAIGQAHIEDPIPALEPRFEVPDQTERWVRTMLAKDRANRFAHAADAAYALAQLPALDNAQRFGVLFNPPDEAPATEIVGAGSQAATQVVPEIKTGHSTSTVRYRSGPPGAVGQGGAGAPAAIEAPPVPVSWRCSREGAISNELMGISLGLFGLRAIPLVDRDDERDWMWQMLRDVHQQGRARCFLVEGSAGTGKSQLVQWLGERARELGAARQLTAYHSPVLGPVDGLVPMMERFLRCARLKEDKRRHHLAKWLKAEGVAAEFDLGALLGLLKEQGDGTEAASGNYMSRAERFAIIYRYLSLVARRRPLVVWLDDVQWGLEAIGFAQYVERQQRSDPAPILIAMTARAEVLRERDDESGALEALFDMSDAERWTLQPLERTDIEDLVRNLLRLNEGLAQDLLQRSEGIPLFAVQLVEDWVARGKLQMGDDGFELRPGADATIPDDLHALWDERIEGFLDNQPDDVLGHLEIAAVLGQEVEHDEWKHAREEAELEEVAGLVDRLVDEDLAKAMDNGWRFAHGLLRESLERGAREAQRWAKWNACCARTLEELYRGDEANISERIAWYWIEADRPEKALEPLNTAIHAAIRRSDYEHAQNLIDWRGVVSDDDQRWALANDVERARVAVSRGDYRRCAELSEKTRSQAASAGADDLAARAQLWAGVAHRFLGEFDRAEEALHHVRDYFADGEPAQLAQSLLELGRVKEARGDFELARQHFDEARKIFTELGDRFGEARSYNALGDALRRSGRFKDAYEASQQALKRFREFENVSGIADCLNDLAELSRLQNNLETAEEFAREALRLYRAIGSTKEYFVRLNLGMILLQEAKFGDAEELFAYLVDAFEEVGQKAMKAKAGAGHLAARAGLADWDGWKESAQKLERELDDTGAVAPMVTRAMALATRLADEADKSDLADATRRLAQRQSNSIRYTLEAESET